MDHTFYIRAHHYGSPYERGDRGTLDLQTHSHYSIIHKSECKRKQNKMQKKKEKKKERKIE